MRKPPRCRVCGDRLPQSPALSYKNMPAAAQCLPGKEDLARDEGVELQVFQCPSCSLVQLASAPVHYSREVIRSTAFSAEMQAFRVQQLRCFADQHGLKGKRVLEVGSGPGDFLSVLSQVGMQATGTEYSARAVEACRAEGLTVHRGFIRDRRSTVPGGPYAGFFMFNFLEHLPQPLQTLRGIAANLEPDAVGLVEVPNFDMIIDRGLFAEVHSRPLVVFHGDNTAADLEPGRIRCPGV